VNTSGFCAQNYKEHATKRATPSHNPKYTTQEPEALIANHDDSTTVNISTLLET
jgi:hypothetical protein